MTSVDYFAIKEQMTTNRKLTAAFKTLPMKLGCILPLVMLSVPVFAQSPQRILETTQAPSSDMHTSPDAAKDVCGALETFKGGAKYEWTPVFSGYKSIEIVAPFFESHPFWRGDIGLHLVSVATDGITKLKRCESIAVARDVNRGRISVEALPDHEYGFAVVISLVSGE